jgi:amino acid adenylation domain-containing protein
MAQFDLMLDVEEAHAQLELSWQYNVDLFRPATIERLAASFEQLLAAALADPQRPVGTLPLFDSAERARLLQWGLGAVRPVPDEPVHTLFERQAAATPEAVAVLADERHWTYAELAADARQLAETLQRHGLRAGERAITFLGRSYELIVAQLAILQCGAAYVPLEPGLPEERRAFLLADCAPRLVIQAAEEFGAPPAIEVRAAAAAAVGGEPVACVMYTSGSTGQPKGVLVPHRAIVRLVVNSGYVALDGEATLAFAANPAFDAATFEVWGALLNGGRVAVIDPATLLEPARFAAALQQYRVTVLLLTVGLFNQYAEPLREPLAQLDALLVGGDVLDAEVIRRVLRHGPPRQLLNGYGPTEGTTLTTTHRIDVLAEGRASVPIGRPIANTQVYVLDDAGEPVPVGVAGELYVGGAGVALGYLQRPELTAERFLPDRFGPEPGRLLYRSGDLVRWLPDGTLEFLGRRDQQVKLRGFRIELGEIEARLAEHPAVREAVVAVHPLPGGDKRLVAYFCAAEEVTVEALRAHLRQRLPDYMLPAALVALPALPLTANGKVDRRALPALVWAAEDVYVAPATASEQLLAELWSELLQPGRPVSAQDNFFALGGHSLLAMRLTARLKQLRQVVLPPTVIFEAQTLAALAERIDRAMPIATADADAIPRRAAGAAATAPLSYGQQRLWLIDQLGGGASVQYHMPTVLELTGLLDVARLQAALLAVVQRHEVLRTTYISKGDTALQQVNEVNALALPVADIAANAAAVEAAVDAVVARPFDLSHELPLRAQLLRLAPERHVLVLVLHHIASDGWSSAIAVDECCAAYAALGDGRTPGWAPLAVQYADYAHWQRQPAQAARYEQQLGYWRQRLAGLPEVHNLPLDFPRPAQQRFAGATHRSCLPLALTTQLREVCRTHGATLFMGLHAVFSALLSRFSGETDIVVGTPIANREQPEIAGLIGFFVNTLVLRADLSARPGFAGLLDQCRQTCLDAYANQQLPFDQLVEALQPQRSLSYSPLFQVMLALQNNTEAKLELPGLQVQPLELGQQMAQFDLMLDVEEVDGGLELAWEYDVDLFDAATVHRLAEGFEVLLTASLAEPHLAVDRLSVLAPPERQRLLAAGRGETLTVRPGCLHQAFEAVAARQPDAVAVLDGALALRYGELNQKANRVAHGLRQAGVGLGDRVALHLYKSHRISVAMLGVLKAGAAYVPLEPGQPLERQQHYLADSMPKAVLSDEVHPPVGLLEAGGPTWLQIDALARDDGLDEHNPQVEGLDAQALAYVVYTSGSTGKPKGVMVEHLAMQHRLAGWTQVFGLDRRPPAVLQMAGLGVDICFGDLLKALCNGGRLVVCRPETLLDPAHLLALLEDSQASFGDFVPAVLRELVDEAQRRGARLAHLKHVFVGSEAWTGADLARLQAVLGPQGRCYNVYGQTESVIDVSCHDLTAASVAAQRVVPMGSPLGNTQILVLGAGGELQPVGVAGEIHIGGPGLARGYLNRPELTAERFVVLPGQAGLVYRTGDMARWRSDGTLEFLGRGDQQVKIRGFRIELGEVEAALTASAGVREAVALPLQGGALGDGNARLVAYVVMDAAEPAGGRRLRETLAQTLPDYMVPSAIVVLDAFPLLPNGKLDRRSLPMPDWSEGAGEVAPRTPLEIQLAQVWAEVLGLASVGVTGNFFALGGDSIRAVRLVAHCRRLGWQFAVRDLFQHQTIERLAAALSARSAAAADASPADASPADGGPADGGPFSLLTVAERAAIDHERYQDGYPLTLLQQGMVFHNLRDGQYLILETMQLERTWSEPAFREALDGLIARHEMLRTVFDYDTDGRPLQWVLRQSPAPLQVHDWRQLLEAESAARFQSWYDAQAADTGMFDGRTPLWCVHIHRVSDTAFRYTLIHHHAILDGWSVASFNTELFQRYLAAQGLAEPLAAAPVSPYRVYVAAELASQADPSAQQFWKGVLADAVVPSWHAEERGKLQSHSADFSAQSEPLRALCARLGVSPRVVLLAVYLRVLAYLNGTTAITSAVTGHGRLEDEGGDRSLGLFLSTLPISLAVDWPSWDELILAVDRHQQQAWNHRHYPVPQLQKETGLDLAAALFNYTDFHVYEAVADDGVSGANTLEITNYRLVCHWHHDNQRGHLQLSLTTDTGLYDTSALQRVLGYFGQALDAALLRSGEPVRTASLLAPSEREWLLQWGRAQRLPAPMHCLHQRFAKQAAAAPAAVAVVDGERQWTYGELDAQSNRLAHRLQAAGAKRGDRVGLCLERSGEVVVAMLAILKCGACYVPLDPIYPAERIRYTLDDAAVGIVIAETATQERVGGRTVLRLDDPALLEGCSDHAPMVEVSTADLTYVIYTSGSTGKPKGVMVSHANVARLFTSTAPWYGFGPADTWCLFHSYAFDFSVWEIWGALLYGGRLVVVPREVAQSTPDFHQLVREQRVTVLNQTPSAFYAFIEQDRQAPGPLALRWVIFGGEALALDKLLPWLDRHGDRQPQLVNMYGITETTVHVTWRPITRADAERNLGSLIGRPIPDLTLWLLDKYGEPVPQGVVGELCVGGAGVAAGYLNRPELTAERFVEHPDLPAGERLYRSGDLARLRADGELEYLGRGDHQVKIRGFRIELGEIEAALRACAGVQDAVVLADRRSAGQTWLVAYVLAPGGELDAAGLRAQLAATLPEYMLPAAFASVAAWPLTANGKLDTAALPKAEVVATAVHVEPATPVERQLAEIIRTALELAGAVSVDANFFALGGDSLMAARITAQCRRRGLPVTVRDIFIAPTIQQLAARLSANPPTGPATPAAETASQNI